MTDLLGPVASIDPEALEAAAYDVRDYCGWHIAPSRVETLTFDGSSDLILPSLYVTAATITVDGSEIDPTWFTAYRNGILRWHHRYDWRSPSIVSVTFTHGHAVCPANVARVVRALAKAGTSVSGSTVRVGQVSVTSNGAGSAEVGSYASALWPYRIPRLA